MLCLVVWVLFSFVSFIQADSDSGRLRAWHGGPNLTKYWRQLEVEVQNTSIIGRAFEAEDIKIGVFTTLHSGLPLGSCASLSVQYTDIISKEDGTYRVPHSRIFMDGKKCGTLSDNATEEELWVDKHMELIPVEFLANESISRRRNTNAAYFKLQARRFARAFYDFSLSEFDQDPAGSNTWIGFERWQDRVCGNSSSGEVRLPKNTFIFFGKNDDVRVNLTRLITRLNGDLVLERFNPYHIAFRQSEDGSDDHVCPQIYLDPNRREDAGEVRKCFPGGVTVQVHTGATIRMEDLKVGDRVRDASGGYSAVYMFSHRLSSTRTEFVRVHTTSGHALTISPGHYVHTSMGLVQASGLRIGDDVITTNGVVRVCRKERHWDVGLFNPHTMSGSIVVNDIVSSVYTRAVEPTVAHSLLAPVRAVFWLCDVFERGQEFLGKLFHSGGGDFLSKLVPRGQDVVLSVRTASVLV